MPPTVTLTKEGEAIDVPVEHSAYYEHAGWRPESADQRADREDAALKTERTPGLLGTSALGFARGATLGASDIPVKIFGGQRYSREAREAHPIASIGSEIAGAIATSELTGGGSLEAEGASLAATGFQRAAAEGAAWNTGSYLSDVALGDRKLSGQGFVGAVGEGALWGGAGHLALSGGAKALTYARKLFPSGAIDARAAATAERDLVDALDRARSDGDALNDSARARMREVREEIATDPVKRAEHDVVAQNAAYDQAAQESPQAAVSQAVGAEGAPTVETASEPDALLSRLRSTKSRLDEGATLKDLSSRASPIAVEDAVNGHIAKTNPEMQRLVTAHAELRNAGDAMDRWLATAGEAEDFARTGRTGGVKRGQVHEGRVEISHEAPAGENMLPDMPTREDRQRAVKDWIAKTRPTEAGYYTSVPEGEGNVALPRGRQSEFRGAPHEQAIAELDYLGRHERQPSLADRIVGGEDVKLRGEGYEPTIKGKSAAERVEGRPGAPVTADDIIGISNAQRAERGLPDLNEKIKSALRAKVNKRFVNEDVSKAIDALSRFEHAHAEMADALGPKVRPDIGERAKAYRAAQAEHEAKSAAQTATATDNINDGGWRPETPQEKAADQARAKAQARSDREYQDAFMADPKRRARFDAELHRYDDKPPSASTGSPLHRRVAAGLRTYGEVSELLDAMGIHIPTASAIPIIGPLLSLYLKARVASRVLGREGWMIGKTTESVIAQKAARTRDRILRAVDSIGEKVKAVPKPSASVLTVLSHELFRAPGQIAARAPATEAEAFGMRAKELLQTAQPGVLRAAVNDKVRASDPEIADSIASTQERMHSFLLAKMPKPSMPGGAFDLEPGWTPDRQALAEWSRYVQAAHDPAAVIERAGAGGLPTHEELETLRTVYPDLYAEAQRHLVEKLTSGKVTIPYARRVQLGVMFELPTDASLANGFGAFVQAHQPAPTAAQPQAIPGQPTIRADVNVGARTGIKYDQG